MTCDSELNQSLKKLILLKGIGSVGKTSTLCALIDVLKTKYSAAEVCRKWDPDNYFVVLDVPNLGNIGVATFGDPGWESPAEEVCNTCWEHNCVAMVVATRTRGGVYNVYREFAENKQIKLIETAPYVVTNVANKKDAAIAEKHQSLNSLRANQLAELLFQA